MSGVTNLFDSGEPPAAKTAKTAKSRSANGGTNGAGQTLAGLHREPHASEAGAFPVHCMPPILQAMVRETSRVTQTPDSLGALVALGIVSASLGGGILVQSGAGRVTPPNLFLLGIARSGTGKGRVFSILSKPFYDAERQVVDRWLEREKPGIDVSLRIAVRRSEAKEKEAAKENDDRARQLLTYELQRLEEERRRLERQRDSTPCFTVADVTREKLAQVMAGQPGEAVASLSAEARGIVGVVMGRYTNGKSSDEDIYLSGYSGDPLRVDRMGRPPVMLQAPRLSLLWLIQPDVARKLTEDERMMESGLIPRLLLCDVRAEAEDEPEEFPEMNLVAESAWNSLIHALLDNYRPKGDHPSTIEATQQARETLRLFTNESKKRARSGGDLRDIDSFVARWGENAWRLALCLHCAAHGPEAEGNPLAPETAANAVEILRWFSQSQTDFLSVSRTEKAKLRLDRLVEILRTSGGSQTLRILRRSNGYEEADVRSLAERFPHQVEIRSVKTGGRDSHEASLVSNRNTPQ